MENIDKAPKFNPIKFVRICLKSWLVFAIAIVACLLLFGAYLAIRKPAFEVNAQLMLPPETSSPNIFAMSDLANAMSLSDVFGGSSTENEMAIMRSHSVFLKTVKDMNLNVTYYEKMGFMKWLPAYQKRQLQLTTLPSIPDTIGVGLLFQLTLKDNGNFDIVAKKKNSKFLSVDNVALPTTLDTPWGPFTISKTENFGIEPVEKFRITFGSYDSTADRYTEIVKIFTPNKKTDMIALSFTTPIPKFGELLLSTLIENYNMVGTNQKNEKDNRTLDFVNARIDEMTENMIMSEEAIQNFKLQHNITDISVSATMLAEKSATLDGSLLMAQTENEILRMTKEFLDNPDNKYSLIPTLGTAGATNSSTETASSEISSYNNLILMRMNLALSAKEDNTSLQQLDNEIDAMRQNIMRTVERAYQNSNIKLRDLKAETKETQDKIGSIPGLEKEYREIIRAYSLTSQIYMYLLKQKEETTLSLSKVTPTLITVDKPYTLSEPAMMKTKMVLALAVLLGGLLALVWVFYFRFNRAPLSSVSEIKDITNAPMIGEIMKYNDALPVLDPGSGESIRMMRSNLQFLLQEFDGKVIMVTSNNSGDGKTFLSTNLAAALAMQGARTLLIDANLRNPKVASIFKIDKDAVQLADLADVSALSDSQIAAVGVGDQQLHIIPAGKYNGNPADLLSSTAFAHGVAALRDKFDYIIIETPRLNGYSDTFAMADVPDITLCVDRVNATTPQDVYFVNELRSQGRLKRIAVVANN